MSGEGRCECYGVALVRGSCGKCGRRARSPHPPTPGAMERARGVLGNPPCMDPHPEPGDCWKCDRIAQAIDEAIQGERERLHVWLRNQDGKRMSFAGPKERLARLIDDIETLRQPTKPPEKS